MARRKRIYFAAYARIAGGLLVLAILAGCGRTAEPAATKEPETEVPSAQIVPEPEEQYAGVYYDCDTGDPNLIIEKKDDGTYSIEIGIFRLVYLDDGTGFMTDDGIDFRATVPNGRQVRGTITLENDAAVVTFTDSAWSAYSNMNEYRYSRTPDPDSSDEAQTELSQEAAAGWREYDRALETE